MKKFLSILLCVMMAAALAAVPASAETSTGITGGIGKDPIWMPNQKVFTTLDCLIPGTEAALVLNDLLFYNILGKNDETKMSDEYFDVTVTFKRGGDLVTHGFDGRGNYIFSTKPYYEMTEDGVVDMEISYIHINLRDDLNKHLTLTSHKINEVKDASGKVIIEAGWYLMVDELFSSDGKTMIPEGLVGSYGQARFDIGYPVAWVDDDSDDPFIIVGQENGINKVFGVYSSWYEGYGKETVFVNRLESDYTVMGRNYTTGHSFGWGELKIGVDDKYYTPMVGNTGTIPRIFMYHSSDDPSRAINFSMMFLLRGGQTALIEERSDRDKIIDALAEWIETDFDFMDFKGTPQLSSGFTLYVAGKPQAHIYEYHDDGTLTVPNFKWNEDIFGWVLKGRVLGDYIVSEVELDLERQHTAAATAAASDANPSTGSLHVAGAAAEKQPAAMCGSPLQTVSAR